jgi:hypothetical protein
VEAANHPEKYQRTLSTVIAFIVVVSSSRILVSLREETDQSRVEEDGGAESHRGGHQRDAGPGAGAGGRGVHRADGREKAPVAAARERVRPGERRTSGVRLGVSGSGPVQYVSGGQGGGAEGHLQVGRNGAVGGVDRFCFQRVFENLLLRPASQRQVDIAGAARVPRGVEAELQEVVHVAVESVRGVPVAPRRDRQFQKEQYGPVQCDQRGLAKFEYGVR